ncbi:MAG: hypothetical protein Q8909_17570, partial [Bacteroidota bacterium]|nr:hypothetical protein [Bacteroidota bacterium]
RMLASLNVFILKKVLWTAGLDGVHQFPVHPQRPQRRDKFFPGKAKGILIGGFIGGFLAILWFAALYFWSLFKVSLKEESEKQETEPLT